MTIEPGGLYRARNGAQVLITEWVPYMNGIAGGFWRGIFIASAQPCTWFAGGMYSVVATGADLMDVY